jgi:hypothetical protein
MWTSKMGFDDRRNGEAQVSLGRPLAGDGARTGARSRKAQAILAALVVMAGERTGNAAFALADLLSRRGLERPCETLAAWAREA